MENTKINTSGVNSPKYAIHIVDHSNQPENVIGKYTIDNSKKSHIIELSDFGDSKLNHINAILALIEFANDFGKLIQN